MKKFTKALAMSLGIAAVAGVFAPNASAQALPPPACAACSLWTLSPDAGAFAQGGLVQIDGGMVTFNQSDSQAIGVYGAGFTIANPSGATLKFDANLFSYDSSFFDVFIVTMSTTDYYWNSGMGASSWTWGGANYPGLESYSTIVGGFDSISLAAPGPLYVSLVLNASGDTQFPSTGSFHVEVAAIPEPETYAMLLAGLGLMGFVARRRQRKLAVA